MTPEERKEYLIEMFCKVGCRSFEDAEINSARQSAIIAVEEIIDVVSDIHPFSDSKAIQASIIYWSEVLTLLKKEIE